MAQHLKGFLQPIKYVFVGLDNNVRIPMDREIQIGDLLQTFQRNLVLFGPGRHPQAAASLSLLQPTIFITCQ